MAKQVRAISSFNICIAQAMIYKLIKCVMHYVSWKYVWLTRFISQNHLYQSLTELFIITVMQTAQQCK